MPRKLKFCQGQTRLFDNLKEEDKGREIRIQKREKDPEKTKLNVMKRELGIIFKKNKAGMEITAEEENFYLKNKHLRYKK